MSAIRFIVQGFYSRRDMYGNTYSYAKVTATTTGRSVFIDYAPNVLPLLREHTGADWRDIFTVEDRIEAIRRYNRERKRIGEANIIAGYKVTADTFVAIESPERGE